MEEEAGILDLGDSLDLVDNSPWDNLSRLGRNLLEEAVLVGLGNSPLAFAAKLSLSEETCYTVCLKMMSIK